MIICAIDTEKVRKEGCRGEKCWSFGFKEATVQPFDINLI